MATSSSTTVTESVTNLVDVQSITYIRPNRVRIDLKNARPNTRLYPFFDGIPVDEYCRKAWVQDYPDVPDTEAPSSNALITNSVGSITVVFDIPRGVFTTGEKQFLLSETSRLELFDVLGNTLGLATGTYRTKGLLEIYQTTITNTTTEIIQRPNYIFLPPPPRLDPLAQSFFTYGIEGGLFVTSIDVFFFSKDNSVPVRIDIREMKNGFPTDEPISEDAIAVLDPAYITTSEDASVPAKFYFKVPVYLKGDSDYCFVLQSNSVEYQVWTSRLGEISKETNSVIFQQPYAGSLFKSENNFTWTAEQNEDIKFRINRAKFDTTSAPTVSFAPKQVSYLVYGPQLSTTSGSNIVKFVSEKKHGLEIGNKISITTEELGTYNGIPGVNLSGSFPVTEVLSEYSVAFTVGPNATVTGNILTGGIVYQVFITSQGSGYTTAPTITFSAPPSGVTATGTANVVNGKLVSITVTNKGSGYVSNPIITIGGPGTGASAKAAIDAIFTVAHNNPFTIVSPQISSAVVGTSKITTSLRPTLLNYPGGNVTSYSFGEDMNLPLDKITYLPTNSVLANRENESFYLANNPSVLLNARLFSDNDYVSPVIDYRKPVSLLTSSYSINPKPAVETYGATAAFGTVTSITIVNGGTGYTTAPTLTIVSDPLDETGMGATATATVSGGAITSVTITNPGTGYTKVPSVLVTGTGTNAVLNAVLSPFDTDVATEGTLYSRYLTKRITLGTTSNELQLFSNLYSTNETDVNWYVRTSLSGENINHELSKWKLLSCDESRNKSSSKGQFFEFRFYSGILSPFDTYDLKCVFSSRNPAVSPIIKQYRVVVAA